MKATKSFNFKQVFNEKRASMKSLVIYRWRRWAQRYQSIQEWTLWTQPRYAAPSTWPVIEQWAHPFGLLVLPSGTKIQRHFRSHGLSCTQYFLFFFIISHISLSSFAWFSSSLELRRDGKMRYYQIFSYNTLKNYIVILIFGQVQSDLHNILYNIHIFIIFFINILDIYKILILSYN
jgi:hypothetical protein